MNPRRLGEDYEVWLSGVYLLAVKQGMPTREGFVKGGLAPEEVDDGVGELVARGFLNQGEDEDTWQVVPPRESISRYVQEVEQRMSLIRATTADVDEQWRRAVGRTGRAGLPDLELVGGPAETGDRMAAMHARALSRLWWVMDGSPAGSDLLARASSDPSLVQVRPGVEVRVIIDTALLDEPDVMAHAEQLVTAGHQVRVGNGLPFSVVLCDDRSTLLDLSSHDPDGYGSLEVGRPAAVGALARLIDLTWSLTTPYRLARSAEDWESWDGQLPQLDGRDQKILGLLAAGASDQVIARQAGVSVRTVERRVRYLIEHLGAATRFQAGVQAARRGWL